MELAPYLPRRLLGRLRLGDLAGSDRFEGASLLADLAGFTALGRRLAESGPAGAAKLTRILEACFGVMIEEIHASGGDIVCFAGDAVLAVWPAEGGDRLATVARTAAETASLILAQLKPTPEFRDHGLSLRIGIGVGEATLLMVPAGRGHTYVVAGKAMRDAGLAEKSAKPGQIVLSPRAAQLCGASGPELSGGNRLMAAAPRGYEVIDESLGDSLIVDSMTLAGSTGTLLAPVRETVEVVESARRFLPAAVLQRGGDAEWRAELRTITAVFVNLPLLDPGRPEGEAELRSLLGELGRVVDRLEGTLDKTLVDEKGTTVVLAFGYPPLSHEDDAVRGVQAAMQIAEVLRRAGLKHGIGVSTGRAFCGAYGSGLRREFTMLGDAVNLAARLMQLGKDCVLCDQETVKAAIGRWRFEAATAVEVRGRDGDVAVHRPVATLDATGRHEVLLTGRQQSLHTGALDALTGGMEAVGVSSTRLDALTGDRLQAVDDSEPASALVGREAELAALTERLDALVEDRSGLVLIEGPPGSGKSLLAATLHGLARARGLSVLVGAGDPIAESQFSAWAEALDPIVASEADPATALRELLAGEPELLLWVPLLGPLLGVDLEENDTTRGMSGSQRADATRDLLRALVAAVCARQPTVIVLDDAHWLDPSSLALTVAVQRWVKPVLLVLVGRPRTDDAPAAWTRLVEAAGRVHLPLGSLAGPALVEIARRRLGSRSLSRELEQLILDRAGGSPLLCEELALALRDSGQLVSTRERSALAEGVTPGSVQLPDSVHGLVTSRVDRLRADDQRTLKIAAVLGRDFLQPFLR